MTALTNKPLGTCTATYCTYKHNLSLYIKQHLFKLYRDNVFVSNEGLGLHDYRVKGLRIFHFETPIKVSLYLVIVDLLMDDFVDCILYRLK